MRNPIPEALTPACKPLLPWLQWQQQRKFAEAEQEFTVAEAVLTSAADIEMEPATWLWDLKIPLGELTIAAGREGAAKSQFSVWLAACVTRGRLPGELYGQPRDVIICAREDSWKKTIKPRLVAAGADLSRVHQIGVRYIATGRVAQLTLPLDNDLLRKAVTDKRAALVIFDPLLSVLSPDLNTHRASDVRAAIEPLAEIAHETGCAFLGLAHFAKTEGRDAASLISGSHAFKDVARSILVFARDEVASGVMSHVKSNLGPLPAFSWAYSIETVQMQIGGRTVQIPRFVLGQPTARHVEDLLDTGAARARAEARDFLRRVLGGGPRPSKDVEEEARQLGIASRTLDRARKDLGVGVQKNAQDGKWHLYLPPNSGVLGVVGTVGVVGGVGTLPGQGVFPEQQQRHDVKDANAVHSRAHARARAGWWLAEDGTPRYDWGELYGIAFKNAGPQAE